MLTVLDSKRYDRLIARFEALLHRGPPRSLAAGRVPLLETAPGLLEKRYRRVRKLGDAIGRQSPAAEYHALRIEAKKLRYALEFVGPVYGKQATEFAQRLTALQDLLGLHQDAEVAVTMLHEMAEANARRLGPRTVLAMGAIAERYRKHAQELRDGFPPLYRGIRGDEWRALHRTVEARRVQRGMATRMPPEKP
jgi:CHAD domain-containing protein